MTELVHKEITGKIIGVYYDIYNGTSRTYPEFVYENAMLRDVRRLGIACERQEEYQIRYKGWIVGRQRLDLFVADEIVVELKVTEQITSLHKAQTRSYLKTFDRQVGLLCNFGGAAPEFDRIFFEPRPVENPSPAERAAAGALPDLIAPELTYEIIGALYTVHATLGPGFVHRIYANACYRELQERGVPVHPQKEMQVIYRDEPIASIKFSHLRVGDMALVFPVAIRDINAISFNNIKAWLRVQQIPLAILANFETISLKPLILKTEETLPHAI